jgi:hypothetical protein
MSSVERKTFILIFVWLSATILFAIFSTDLVSDRLLFGLPWIVYLSVIAQLSILALYYVIARFIWKTKGGIG